jgi:hypothetical protein
VEAGDAEVARVTLGDDVGHLRCFSSSDDGTRGAVDLGEALRVIDSAQIMVKHCGGDEVSSLAWRSGKVD